MSDINAIARKHAAHCEEKKHKMCEAQKMRYYTLRDNGLCVRCKQPTRHGMALCCPCAMYNNQRRSGARQAPRG